MRILDSIGWSWEKSKNPSNSPSATESNLIDRPSFVTDRAALVVNILVMNTQVYPSALDQQSNRLKTDRLSFLDHLD